MSNSTITDLGIKQTAMKVVRAVDRLLTRKQKGYVTSSAWYNSRERGVALVVGCFSGVKQVFVINECRGSDQIALDAYETQKWASEVCWTDAGYEAAYEARTYFRYNATATAAKAVAKLIVKAIARAEKELAERKAKVKAQKAGDK